MSPAWVAGFRSCRWRRVLILYQGRRAKSPGGSHSIGKLWPGIDRDLEREHDPFGHWHSVFLCLGESPLGNDRRKGASQFAVKRAQQLDVVRLALFINRETERDDRVI